MDSRCLAAIVKVSLSLVILNFPGSGHAQEIQERTTLDGLTIVAGTDKEEYRIGEEIHVRVCVSNTSSRTLNIQRLGEIGMNPPILTSQTYKEGGRGGRKSWTDASPILAMLLEPGEQISKEFSFVACEAGKVELEAFFHRQERQTHPDLWHGEVTKNLEVTVVDEIDEHVLRVIRDSEIALRAPSATDRIEAIATLATIGLPAADTLLRYYTTLPLSREQERIQTVRALCGSCRRAFPVDVASKLMAIASDQTEHTPVRLEAFDVFEVIMAKGQLHDRLLLIPRDTLTEAMQRLGELKLDRDQSIQQAAEGILDKGMQQGDKEGSFEWPPDASGVEMHEGRADRHMCAVDDSSPDKPDASRESNHHTPGKDAQDAVHHWTLLGYVAALAIVAAMAITVVVLRRR